MLQASRVARRFSAPPPRAAQACAHRQGFVRGWFQPEFRDELFSLTPADFLCYAYAMDHTSRYPTFAGLAPKIGRRLPPANINFDGTNLALEGEPSRHHYIWDGPLLPAVFDHSEVGRRTSVCRIGELNQHR